MKIRKDQIIKIKTLQGKLTMSREEYELVLSEEFVNSCTELKEEEADRVIEKLTEKAVAAGVWEEYNPHLHPSQEGTHKKKYDDLGKRGIQWATPKQCRKVEAMFREISYYKNNEKAFAHAFRNFLERIAHVDDIKFLEKKDVQKVVRALERMKQQKNNPPLHPSQEGTKGGQEGK